MCDMCCGGSSLKFWLGLCLACFLFSIASQFMPLAVGAGHSLLDSQAPSMGSIGAAFTVSGLGIWLMYLTRRHVDVLMIGALGWATALVGFVVWRPVALLGIGVLLYAGLRVRGWGYASR